LTRFGVGGLDTLDFSKGGTKNFSLSIPVGLKLALPPISLDLLGNLVKIPGIELDTDGELNVTMSLKGGFRIEGMVFADVDLTVQHAQPLPTGLKGRVCPKRGMVIVIAAPPFKISSTETTIAGISKMVRTENYEVVLPVVATRRAIACWKAFSILIPTSYRTCLDDDGLASNHCFKVRRCMAFFGILGVFLVLITFFWFQK
jgi:hypothetical protein